MILSPVLGSAPTNSPLSGGSEANTSVMSWVPGWEKEGVSPEVEKRTAPLESMNCSSMRSDTSSSTRRRSAYCLALW